MAPHVLVRVDGDVYAHPILSEDIDAAITYLIDRVACPDEGSTVHAAIVEASDAGAARLAPVLWWVSVDERDPDVACDSASHIGFDPNDPRIAYVPSVAAALARAMERDRERPLAGDES